MMGYKNEYIIMCVCVCVCVSGGIQKGMQYSVCVCAFVGKKAAIATVPLLFLLDNIFLIASNEMHQRKFKDQTFTVIFGLTVIFTKLP